MIMNQTPYPISFEREMSQALVCRYGEEMRQYVFKPDIDVSGLSCLLQIAKTDGTFTENGVEVHTDPDTGECTLVITIPQQATVVKGLNRYSICVYGPIEGEDHLLYSAEGPLWVDDDLITDEMIQSVAEVNGMVFPQDFLTVENLVDIVNYVSAEILNDNTISTETTWSSDKINQEIEGHNPDIDVSKEVTGNPIEFSDGAAAPLVKCVTQITGYQEGTGTPSPDNIRPIVAYTEGEIEVRGKNLFDKDYGSIPNKYITDNGDIADSSPDRPCTIYTQKIKVSHDYNYRLSALSNSGFYLRVAEYDKNDVFIRRIITNGIQTVLPFQPSSNVDYILINPDTSCYNIQLEQGITVTTYEPYTSTTHSTTYPSAIYRGSEDVVKGEVDCQKFVVTYNGMENWVQNPTFENTYYIEFPSGVIKSIDSIFTNKYVARTSGDIGFMIGSYFNISDPINGTSLAEWKAYLSTHPLEVCYTLATPTTTPVEVSNLPIKSLSGYNHIESSTGDMEVEYLTQTYDPIAELIQRSSLHVYSTEEKVVGKWIDGKDIYEITLEISSFSASTYDNGWYYGTVDLSTYGITPEHVFPECAASYITLADTTTRTPVFIDWQGGSNVYPYFIGSRSGDLKLTLRYTKQ